MDFSLFHAEGLQAVHRISRISPHPTSLGRGGSCLSLFPVASSKLGGLFKPSLKLFLISLQNNLAEKSDNDVVLSRFPAKKDYVMITVRKKRADQN